MRWVCQKEDAQYEGKEGSWFLSSMQLVVLQIERGILMLWQAQQGIRNLLIYPSGSEGIEEEHYFTTTLTMH